MGSVDRVLPNSLFIIHNSRKSKGFTLIELLVALALFSITTGLVTNLFLLASRRQARTTTAVRIQSDARLIIETISRELREGTIAYGDLGSHALAITNPNGPQGNLAFFDRVVDGNDAHIDIGRWNGTQVQAPLTSTGVRAEKFDIFVTPDNDPFIWNDDSNNQGYQSNEQPRATIHFVLTAPTGKAGDIVRIEAQTTIASRVYQR